MTCRTCLGPSSRRRALAAAAAWLSLTVWWVSAVGASEAAGTSLAPGVPYAAAIGRAMDAVLDARFADVEGELARACGPAPREACALVRATALWWRLQLDPQNRSLDARIRADLDEVVGAMDRWTTREPRRADAWFFLGAAYGVRVQFRILRGERLAAARDGKRIKDALEQALAIDPGFQDAYFGIGLYHYYADVAPAALKLLRWLLLLPGGDKVQGLREMQRARTHGELLRGETDYQLHFIYVWYEQNVPGALHLLDGLHTRYPHNPIFLQARAHVQEVYLGHVAACRDTWQTLLTLAEKHLVAEPESTAAHARVGLAAALDSLAETDRAIELLRTVVEGRATAPYGIAARAHLGLGLAYDRMGQHDRAAASFQAAIASAPAEDPDGVRARAREAQRRPPNGRVADAYRLSIEGWRHLQRGATEVAADCLSRSLALNGQDPVTRYRLGLLRVAQDRPREALATFERVASMRPYPPAHVTAAACLEAARLLDEAGQRARAIEMYRRASETTVADPATIQAARDALARLRTR